MSGDYISREAAIASLCCDCSATRDCRPGERCVDYQRLKEIPAADVVEVRHGRWERTEGNPYPSCSECGCESLSRADRPYCQFCGAKMDGKSADYAPAKPYDLLYEEGGPDA